MKRIIIISLFSFIVLHFIPWWTFFIILGIFGFIEQSVIDSIILGMVVASIAWGFQLILGLLMGGAILMERVSDMFGLGSPLLLISTTVLFAAIFGGLSSLSGYHLNLLLRPNKQ